MGGFDIGNALKDPIAALDPGGLVYKSSNPDTAAWQAEADIGGIGAKPVVAQQQAAEAQQAADATAIGEQRRQFNTMVSLLSPYTQAGIGALGAQQGLLGLSGDQAQQEAINSILNSPQFASMMGTGENAILQNASATGGIRGGNTQASLAQFRPQLLSQLINQQLGQLGGISAMGQASAAGQAQMGQGTATNIGNLMQQQAASQAGLQLSQANQQAQTTKSILPLIAAFF